MKNRYALVVLTLCGLSGCSDTARLLATATDTPIADAATQALVATMLACVASHDALTPEQLHRQLAKLDSGQANIDSAARFRLACLLSRDSASDAELTRAQSLLDKLAQERDFSSGEPRQLMAVYRHNLELAQQLRQQRRATAEYRHQIEQLKGLENELDPKNAPRKPLP